MLGIIPAKRFARLQGGYAPGFRESEPRAAAPQSGLFTEITRRSDADSEVSPTKRTGVAGNRRPAPRIMLGLIASLLAPTMPHAQGVVTPCVNFNPGPPIPETALGDEFVGPFASWANLKRDYGAVGDGIADDTMAIQTALSALSTASTAAGKSPVLYIPAGTYLVTQTVTVMSAQGISVIGEDPGTTTLKWAGAPGGILLHIDGVAYSRFNRLTFEGANSAGVLVDQSVENFTQGRLFDTGNEYADDVFQNAALGIQGGQYGLGAAETSVLRSKFLNNTSAGIALRNFNALDWWIWYSYFQNNYEGITNNPPVTGGAGNFHAFNNVFVGSTAADLRLLNTGQFNFRDNFSLNSNVFLEEDYYYTNGAVTRLQGNTVIIPATNTCGGCGMYQGNMGPTVMTDNTWVSPANASNPPVLIEAMNPPDCVSVGNTYTFNNPVQCTGYSTGPGRLLTLDDSVVAPSSINQTPPTLPGVLPNYQRQVLEVPAGSNSAAIQQIIQQASSYCGQRPVVHLPYGSYNINTTLVIPAECNIQLVGDGDQTSLVWSGTGVGPVIQLQGPSKAILRDFYVNAGSATGIQVQNADQPQSRIYMQQIQASRSLSANIFVDGLDHTNVELQNFGLEYTAVAPASTGVALKVVGGPLAGAGNPQEGRTNLFAGASGANFVSYLASNGATLLVRDAWYEGSNPSIYALISDNSSVTLEGSRMAVPAGGDAVVLINPSCNAAILSSAPDSDVRIIPGGAGGLGIRIIGGSGDVWVLGNNFGTAESYLNNLAPTVHSAFNLNRHYVPAGPNAGSVAIADIGIPDANFIRTVLAQSRAAHPSDMYDLAGDQTDVRFYRVSVELGTIGIHLEN